MNIDIRFLVDLKTAAEYIRQTPERLQSWVDQGICPFYIMDGISPLFKKGELLEWIGNAMVKRNDPLEFPKLMKIFIPLKSREDIPPAGIANVPNLQLLQMNGTQSGIYFLCLDNEVVYVGQSKSILSRIATHLSEGEKEFDQNRIYFLAMPPEMLGKIEKEFIFSLKPKYNKPDAIALAFNGPVVQQEEFTP